MLAHVLLDLDSYWLQRPRLRYTPLSIGVTPRSTIVSVAAETPEVHAVPGCHNSAMPAVRRSRQGACAVDATGINTFFLLKT